MDPLAIKVTLCHVLGSPEPDCGLFHLSPCSCPSLCIHPTSWSFHINGHSATPVPLFVLFPPPSLLVGHLPTSWILPPCCCSVPQSCPTLCDPINCSTPSFPVLQHLPEFAQIHVHCVSDVIQPSHSLLPPSPLASLPFLASIRVFSNESALCIRWPNTGASASAPVLAMNIQS